MTTPRLPFIDWMKGLGILLIVYGHVGAASIDALTPPVYPKQLGVAFFLFVAGYSLANEKRGGTRVVFNRLFEIFLFGVPFALLLSAVTYAWRGGLAASNYLPFLLGANVVFNHFPANPTTWYIGTYIQVLLLWALLLRRVRIRPWMLAAALVGEIAVRAGLAGAAGLYVAYMALPNWVTVFLLGVYQGQQPPRPSRIGLAPWLAALTLLAVGWPLLCGGWRREPTFPFMCFAVGSSVLDQIVTSALISGVYLVYTGLTYAVTSRLPDLAPVRFVARNTLIVFIVHMPVYYALIGPVGRLTPLYWLRVTAWFVACFPALALLSELVRRLTRPEALRERVWRLFSRNAQRQPALDGRPIAATISPAARL